MIDKINKLSLPVTVLIGCIILGGFYYASETNKQASIERQQQSDLQMRRDEQQAVVIQNNLVAKQKSDCVTQAQQTAISEYKSAYCSGTEPMFVGDSTTLTKCYDGTYLVSQYDNAYNTCLESKGLK